MNDRVSYWKFRHGRVKYPISKRIEIREDEPLELFELTPHEPFYIGNLQCEANEQGQFKFNFMTNEQFRCHIGIIEVTAEDGSQFEVDVLPGKFTQREFEILKDELQSVWAGIILDAEGISAVAAMQQSRPANELWDNRARRALQSLLENPPTQLESRQTLVSISRVRQLGTPDIRLVMAKERGLPLQALAPTPTVKTAELYFVRDTLIRLQSLAKRQIGLSEPGSSQYFELLNTSRSISRFLQHPTLDVHPTRCRPTHLMSTDRRLNIFLKLRSALSQLDAPLIIGPGDLRLGVKGIDRIYEIWVFLKVLQAATIIYGSPVSGLEQLATRSNSRNLELHIEDGAEVLFPGDIKISFTPAIFTNQASSWEGLDFLSNPSFENPPIKATPDIMILGPQNDAVVIDAKYRARHYIDKSTVEVHAKYSRFRRNGIGVVAQVIGAHPHSDIAYKFAGYSAQPFVPGHEISEIPWPVPAIIHDDESSSTTIENLVVDLVHELQIPALPVLGRIETHPVAPVRSDELASRPQNIKWGRNPNMAIIDVMWLYDVMNSRQLDFPRLAERCQRERGCHGIFVALKRYEGNSFINLAQQHGWEVVFGEDRQDVLSEVRKLISKSSPEEIVMISNKQDFLDISKDFTLNAENMRDDQQLPLFR
jgi:hypothetical protein